ncbi:hypothetical protein JL720_8142 [Aureococcus anophagefferens]|nr:hypothetical protein JL720_8142 [Aureococcus anophagefferens]
MLKKERSGRGIVNKGKDLDRPSIAEETKSHVADSFHVIKKHGCLEKLSRGAMAGYQKRYSVLSGPYLKYCKTDQRKELLAAVDVRPVLLEVGSDARMKARTLSLRLPHEDARFVLRAESPKDRDAWLRAIAEVQVEAKRDSSATWADSDSLKIVAGGADGAKADALPRRGPGRADLESPRASEARASTFDGRHVSSLTAASVVPDALALHVTGEVRGAATLENFKYRDARLVEARYYSGEDLLGEARAANEALRRLAKVLDEQPSKQLRRIVERLGLALDGLLARKDDVAGSSGRGVRRRRFGGRVLRVLYPREELRGPGAPEPRRAPRRALVEFESVPGLCESHGFTDALGRARHNAGLAFLEVPDLGAAAREFAAARATFEAVLAGAGKG